MQLFCHRPVWWSLGRCCARTPGSRWQSASSAASQHERSFPGPPARWSPQLLRRKKIHIYTWHIGNKQKQSRIFPAFEGRCSKQTPPFNFHITASLHINTVKVKAQLLRKVRHSLLYHPDDSWKRNSVQNFWLSSCSVANFTYCQVRHNIWTFITN